MSKLKKWQWTDIGRQKDRYDENEDSKFASNERPYYIMADGISEGGKGKDASLLAVTIAKLEFESLYKDLKNKLVKKENIDDYIREIYKHINECLIALSKNIDKFKRAGTTLDVCYIQDGRAYIGHIGDSRVYHYKAADNSLEQLTTDHTDIISTDSKFSKIYQMKARLKRYLPLQGLEPDILTVRLSLDDMILMATDGLTNYVSDEEIRDVLSKDIESAPRKLVNLANKPRDMTKLFAEYEGIAFEKAQEKYGGKDNISVIVIRNGGS